MTSLIKRIFYAVVAVLLTSTASKSQTATAYTKFVNTFVGTTPLTGSAILGYNLPKGWRSWAGLTFPGSSLPNAMVQLSPITEYGSGAGYEYEGVPMNEVAERIGLQSCSNFSRVFKKEYGKLPLQFMQSLKKN